MPGYFSEEFIQEVISANDIADVIGDYVQLKKQSSGMVGLCPFHKEKTPSFHVSPDKQLYHCFGCGVGGTVINFLMQAENFDFVEAVKFLAERASIPIPERGDAGNERYERKQRIYQMNRLAARFFFKALYDPSAKEAQAYVKKRGLNRETLKTYGIGYAPNAWDKLLKHLEGEGFHRGEIVDAGLAIANEKGHIYDRFRHRLMFPIIDVRGNVIGFSGRVLEADAKGMKYMNTPETLVFSKGKNLFSLNLAKKSGEDSLILAEGQMDVISLYQNGIKNAIATLGTAITPEQAWLISRYTKKVYICYDSDTAGEKATQRAIEQFRGLDVTVRVMEIPQGKDPDEYIKSHSVEAFEQLNHNAKNMISYRIGQLKKKYNFEDIGQKIEFSKEAVRILAGVSNEVERDVHIRALAEELEVSVESIRAEVRKELYRKGRNEERAALRNVVKTERTAVLKDRQKGVDHVLVEAEARLLAAIYAERDAYRHLESRIVIDDFTIPLHRVLAEKIMSEWKKERVPDAANIVAGLPPEDQPAASGVFASSDKSAGGIQAAEEAYDRWMTVRLDHAISDAAKNGDVEQMSRYLKQKKEYEERRNAQ